VAEVDDIGKRGGRDSNQHARYGHVGHR
jgi:hypothetical protein